MRARQGKLRAVKLGRNWVTTKEWLSEYLESVATEQADEVMIAGSAARKSGPRPTGKKYLTEKHWVSRFVFFSATLNLLARQGFSVGGFQYFVRSRNKFGMILKAIYGHCSRGLEKFFSFRIKRFDCRLADLARITMVVVSIGALVCLVAGPSVGLIRNEARETKGLGVGVWNGIQRLVVENAVSLGEFSAEDDFLRPVSVSAKNLIGAGSEVLAGAINWGGSLPDEMLSGLESQRFSLARNFKAASHNFVFVSGTGLEVIADAYGQAPDNIEAEWLAMRGNLGASMILGASSAKARLVLGAGRVDLALSDLRQRAQGLTVENGVAAAEGFLVKGKSASLSLARDLKRMPLEIYLSARRLRVVMVDIVGSDTNFFLNYRTGARVVFEAYRNALENIVSGWKTIENRNQLAKERLENVTFATKDKVSNISRRLFVAASEKFFTAARGTQRAFAGIRTRFHEITTEKIIDALTGFRDVATNFNSWRLPKKYSEISEVKMPVQSVKEGVVAVPSTGSDEEMRKKIQESFSDEVTIQRQDETSGLITPVFREREGGKYLYMMVPVKENN